MDVSLKQINTYSNTPPVYGYKANARYYGVNLISELDMIDEYYIDIKNKIVYISKERQSTLSSDKYYISVNPIPIDIAGFGDGKKSKWGRKDFWNDDGYLSNIAIPPGRSGVEKPKWIKPPKSPLTSSIQYVSIENITIGYGTQVGLSATDVSNCNFKNIIVYGIGENGIVVNGYNNTIENNRVTDVGCTGINVEGGDLDSLTPGNNMVTSNFVQYHAQWFVQIIHHLSTIFFIHFLFCKRHRTYVPAVAFGGVGNQWLNNYAGYGPHNGFLGSCNDCLFDGNTFEMLCYEVSDAGAWYSGRSWVHRGNIISNNKFINIHNVEHIVLGYPSVEGVYLDDQLSGTNVTNNQFINCQAGMLLGGGRRVEVHNNKFASCPTSVLYDDRGLTWQNSYCKPGGTFNQQLNDVKYQQPPWSIHYPYLPNIFNEQPCTPVYDRITGNEYCCGKANGCKFIDDSIATCQGWNSTCDDNTQTSWSTQYC